MTQRSKLLQKKYGLTEAQWLKMFKRQKGKCPICLRKLFKPGNPEGRTAAAVEHCHTTGRVRGLACYPCNRWRIGRNSIETARRLLEYMESTFDGRLL